MSTTNKRTQILHGDPPDEAERYALEILQRFPTAVSDKVAGILNTMMKNLGLGLEKQFFRRIPAIKRRYKTILKGMSETLSYVDEHGVQHEVDGVRFKDVSHVGTASISLPCLSYQC